MSEIIVRYEHSSVDNGMVRDLFGDFICYTDYLVLEKQLKTAIDALESVVQAEAWPMTTPFSYAGCRRFWEYEQTQGRGDAPFWLNILDILAKIKGDAA